MARRSSSEVTSIARPLTLTFWPERRSRHPPRSGLETALQREGLQVERVLDGSGFTRRPVTGDVDGTEVDFGSDAHIFPVDRRRGLPMLSGEELAVDKVLQSSVGQSLGTSWISPHSSIATASIGCSSWQQRRISASMCASLPKWPTDLSAFREKEFLFDDDKYQALSRVVAGWRTRAVEVARLRGPGQNFAR